VAELDRILLVIDQTAPINTATVWEIYGARRTAA
jgi:hypothetical protein